MNIYLDIETIPSQKQGVFEHILAQTQANFKAPANLTKEQMAKDLGITAPNEIKFTSAASMREQWQAKMAASQAPILAQAQYRQTALNGAKGEIYCIGLAIDNGKVQVIKGDTEAQTLQQFFAALSGSLKLQWAYQFIGHNINDFDLRFIYQRAVINQIKPSVELIYSRYSDCVYDTMTAWAGFGNRISLNDLCQALDLPTPKDDIDGSQVFDCIQKGEHQRVLDYCAKDVETIRQVHKRLSFQAV